jgi:hypothetical protein
MNVSSDMCEILLPRNASAHSRFGIELIPIGTLQKAESSRARPALLAAAQGMVFAFMVRERLRGTR